MNEESIPESGRRTLAVLRRIGSPGASPHYEPGADPAMIREEYDWAYASRIGLLYLLALPDEPPLRAFIVEREKLLQREARTRDVIRRLCTALDEGGFAYAIFKTVRPFPFTPNDTDVLFLESRSRYREAVAYLLARGYQPHGEAPLQTLVYDAEGIGKVGKGKSGGVYYIDLYRAAGADYFVYLDSATARANLKTLALDGFRVPVVRPELELAVLLFHNVFPENSYHLEHFYLPLFYLCGPAPFDAALFVEMVRQNHFVAPARANLSLTAYLHELAFGYVPDELAATLKALGGPDEKANERFVGSGMTMPHRFGGRLFVRSALAKLAERPSLLSLGEQGIHMLSPLFLWSVIRAIRLRVLGPGSYDQA